MANTKSAAKRARQAVKRHARNKAIVSTVRTAVRKAREALAGGDAAAVDTAQRSAERSLTRAANSGVIHKRNAQRRISRLAKAANAKKAAAAPKA